MTARKVEHEVQNVVIESDPGRGVYRCKCGVQPEQNGKNDPVGRAAVRKHVREKQRRDGGRLTYTRV